MYDDLARSQRRSVLEWLVVNALIPSVLVTFALQWRPAQNSKAAPVVYTDMCFLPSESIIERMPGGPIPDAFPILISMPRPSYPALMRRLGVEDRVVLRALVNVDGQVDASSILVLQATRGDFVQAARQALAAALYQPGRFGGHPGAAWITIAIDFSLHQE